jgi:hypothetical protein
MGLTWGTLYGMTSSSLGAIQLDPMCLGRIINHTCLDKWGHLSLIGISQLHSNLYMFFNEQPLKMEIKSKSLKAICLNQTKNKLWLLTINFLIFDQFIALVNCKIHWNDNYYMVIQGLMDNKNPWKSLPFYLKWRAKKYKVQLI